MSALKKFEIDTPQRHFELLHTPNQYGTAILWERQGLGKHWHKLAPGDVHMPVLLQAQQGAEDSFITVNEFRYWRQVDNLKSLRAMYADIDRPIREDELVNLLHEAKLPWPSMVVWSGRGVHLYWLHKPMPAQVLPVWQRCQDHIIKSLTFAGVDKGAKDCARVLRLCGTINAKNGEVVRGKVYDPTQWDFHSLCDEMLGFRPEFKAKVIDFATEKAKRGLRIKTNSIYDWWHLVYHDLLAIAKYHWFGGIPDGHRNNFLFLSSVALSWFAHAETLESELVNQAKTWTPTWSTEKVRNTIMPALKKAEKAASGEKVIWNEQERDPRYWFKRETLHQLMEPIIPPELAPKLRAIVSDEIRAAHRKEQERARHKLTAEEYHNRDSTEKAEPWVELGISRRSYYYRKKAGKI